ncbi:trehalose-6-phosphate synthase [Dactylosporangium sp. NPDC050688]|uniref:alpha,alpha-trehalose-phosphate synthase (UDP-forming) n=1 Tax=Dactylosporangium sp. NPDC050688 TaxID=3157217 RepID=UPI0033CE52A1
MLAAAKHDFVVVTEHLPVDPVLDGSEPVRWRASHSGVNAALHSIVARRHGTWIGWHGLNDRHVGRLRWDGISLQPVPMPVVDVADHLGGHCETSLAPLYHDGVEPPQFDRRWRQAYRRVNDRYSHAVAGIAAPGATVWVHDYHLQLVPAMLRGLRPDLLIGFFLHVPFPPVELFEKLPQRQEILGGLLGADLIGFQSRRSSANFWQAVTEFGEYRMDADVVHPDGRRVSIGVFPASVDAVDFERRARDPLTRRRAAEIRAELGKPRTILLAVDHLEPAKGIEQRLDAYHELLAEGRLDPTTTLLIQVAVPGRQHGLDRPDAWTRVERKVAQINGLYSWITRPAVHFLHQALVPRELVAFYLAADVMLATPLRAGMNVTAKEYVACRTDNTGTLVLSEGSGTAAGFPEAITVNPYDVDALKAAILSAIEPANPGRRRVEMRAMRRRLHEHDVHRWAAEYLHALSNTTTRPSPDVSTVNG